MKYRADQQISPDGRDHPEGGLHQAVTHTEPLRRREERQLLLSETLPAACFLTRHLTLHLNGATHHAIRFRNVHSLPSERPWAHRG